MRVAKSVTLEMGLLERIDKLAVAENVSTSRLIENLLVRGLNSKIDELKVQNDRILKSEVKAQ